MWHFRFFGIKIEILLIVECIIWLMQSDSTLAIWKHEKNPRVVTILLLKQAIQQCSIVTHIIEAYWDAIIINTYLRKF